MRLIYVAGKYTGKDWDQVQSHIDKAENASVQLFAKGWNVVTPHKNNAHYEVYEDRFKTLDYRFWIKATLDLLSRCDAIFVLDNWYSSQGTIGEIKFALEHNIPIYFEDDGIPDLNGEPKNITKDGFETTLELVEKRIVL